VRLAAYLIPSPFNYVFISVDVILKAPLPQIIKEPSVFFAKKPSSEE